MNKRERPLHSERTSILHGWLLRFCQNIVTRFDRTSRLLVWLYLIVFDQFNYKISGNAVQTAKQTTHGAKVKTVQTKNQKKVEESDRNEKIELRCCLTKNRFRSHIKDIK